MKSKSFYDIRLWTKQLARCEKVANRIQKNRHKNILQKSFEKLALNAKWSISFKRALMLLTSTLKARSVKAEAMNELKLRASRRKFHFNCAKHLLSSIRAVSKRMAFEGISKWSLLSLEKTKTADTYYGLVKFSHKQKIFEAWHKVLKRRKQLDAKGEILNANSELRLIDSFYRKWHDRVLNSKFSLYGREQALSKCLWQARAIRAIDTMISRE